MTTKQKKNFKEVAIEIKQNEIEYDKFVKESRQALELLEKEYQATILKANEKPDKFKFNTIKRAGSLLEKLIPKQKISGRLKRDFKGVISRAMIYFVCRDLDLGWIRKNPNQQWGNQYGNKSYSTQTEHEKLAFLTQQEQEYVKAHEDEYRRNHLVDELLQLWTGKTSEEQAQIHRETPKGSNWRKRLVEESKDHMFTVFKQMTDSYVIGTVNDMRTVVEIASAFGDMGYQEQELRKKKSAMESV